MARVKQGRIIQVDNTDRKFGSASSYKAVWVEDSNGKNERCLLFTDLEIEVAQKRANENIEDLTKKSFLTDLVD
jgi:hypothetical protein